MIIYLMQVSGIRLVPLKSSSKLSSLPRWPRLSYVPNPETTLEAKEMSSANWFKSRVLDWSLAKRILLCLVPNSQATRQ